MRGTVLDLCAGAWEEEDAPPCLLVQQTEGISGGGEATGGEGGGPNQAPVPLIARGCPDSHPLCSQAGTPTPLNSPKS